MRDSLATMASVEVGKSFIATVTHVDVEYPWLRIFVQQDYQQVESIENYMQNLEARLSESSGFLNLNEVQKGARLFAQFSDDKKWYRAQVTGTVKGSLQLVNVTFIDYGNTETVALNSLRIPEDNVFSIPALALPCHLSYLERQKYSAEAINEMSEKALSILQYEEVTVTVMAYNGRVPVVSINHGIYGDIATLLEKSSLAVYPEATKCYSCYEIELDKIYKVYVSHVGSGGVVHIQLQVMDNSKVMEDLQQYVQTNQLVPEMNVAIGTCCIAKFSEDEQFYRAVVTSIQGSFVEILFVDYGNTEIKNANEIFSIPDVFMNDPVFAIKGVWEKAKGLDVDSIRNMTEDIELQCVFLGTEGPNGYFIDFPDLLLDKSTDVTLQQMSLPVSGTFHLIIQYVASANEIYGQLVETADTVEKITNELHEYALNAEAPQHIQCGVAVAVLYEDIWYRAKILEVLPGKDLKVWIGDYGDTVVVSSKDVRHLDTRFLLEPAQAVRLILSNITVPVDAENKVKEALEKLILSEEVKVVVGAKDAESTHIVEIYMGNPPVNVNEKIKMYINSISGMGDVGVGKVQEELGSTAVVIKPPDIMRKEKLSITVFTSVDDFFGQLCRLSDDEFCELQTLLNSTYPSLPANTAYLPKQGEFVCAKFSEDDTFYRAKVESVEGNLINVFFVDYGNREAVSINNVYPLKPEFVQLPQQGICCQAVDPLPKLDFDNIVDSEMTVEIISMNESFCTVKILGDSEDCGKVVPQVTPAPAMDVIKYPSESFPLNKIVNVDIVYIVSPGEFYCQDLSYSTKLSAMMEQLVSICGHPSQEIITPVVGSACCALYSEDGSWYRGTVTSQTSSGTCIYFVDYGNSEEVPLNSIKRLPPEFANIPPLAVKCSLASVSPNGSGMWSDEAVKYFEEIIDGKTMQVEVFQKLPDGSYSVQLTCKEMPAVSINQALVNHGHAVGGEAVDSSCAKVVEVTNVTYSTPGSSVKTIDYTPLSFPSNTCCSVTVSWILNPAEFYCQLTESASDLTNLMNELQKYYSSCSTALPPIPGQPCVARYTDDGVWYRARATHSKAGMIGVMYVDFGNCGEVPENSTCKILPQFLALPTQAIHCQLQGVAAPEAGWPTVDPQRFEKYFGGAHNCNVHSSCNGSYLVDLQRDGVSIADLIIRDGLGKAMIKSSSDVGYIARPHLHINPFKGSFHPNQFIDVRVCWVVSTDSFWCVLQDATDSLAELTVQLQESAKAVKKLPNPVIGEACLAFYSRLNIWARGTIRSRPSPGSLEVFFNDIGETRVVNHAEVKIIQVELTELPSQAFQCSLVTDGKEVSESKLKENILERDLVLQVIEQLNTKVKGSLFDTSDYKEVNILDELVEVTTEVPQEAALGSIPETKQCYPSATEIPERMSVFVSHVKDFDHFYVNSRDQETALQELSDLLQSSCEQLPELTNPAPGLPCAACYSQNGLWYRAVVLEVADKLIKVQFVDYGNQDDVESVKELGPDLLAVPPYCFTCELVLDNSFKKDLTMLEKFENEVLEGDLEIIVVQRKVCSSVVKLLKGGVNIAEVIGGHEPIEVPEIAAFKVDLTEHEQLESAESIKETAEQNEAPKEALVDQLFPHIEILVEPFSAFVTQVEGLNCFYISKTEDEQKLSSLSDSLQNCCANCQEIVEPKPGTACAALFSNDGLWYRAEVLKVTELGVKVLFVDYGNSDVVSQVVSLPEELKNLPPFAIRCTLEGVSSNTISEASRGHLESLLAETVVTVKVVEWKDPVVVKLETSEGEDVLSKLIQELHMDVSERVQEVEFDSKQPEETIGVSELTEEAPENVEAEIECVEPTEKVSDSNEVLRSTEQSEDDFEEFQEANEELEAEPKQCQETEVEQYSQTVEELGGDSEEAELATLENETDSRATLEVTTEGQPDIKETGETSDDEIKCYLPPAVPLHHRTLVTTSYVNSPLEFWIQTSDTVNTLSTLTEDLSLLEKSDKDCALNIGSACLALFSDDALYRARIINLSEDSVTVNFVDYGNTETMGLKDVYPIEQKFMNLPMLAVKCTLDISSDCAVDETVIQKFRDSVEEKTLLCEFLDLKDDKYRVRLLDMGIDISTVIFPSLEQVENENLNAVDLNERPALKASFELSQAEISSELSTTFDSKTTSTPQKAGKVKFPNVTTSIDETYESSEVVSQGDTVNTAFVMSTSELVPRPKSPENEVFSCEDDEELERLIQEESENIGSLDAPEAAPEEKLDIAAVEPGDSKLENKRDSKENDLSHTVAKPEQCSSGKNSDDEQNMNGDTSQTESSLISDGSNSDNGCPEGEVFYSTGRRKSLDDSILPGSVTSTEGDTPARMIDSEKPGDIVTSVDKPGDIVTTVVDTEAEKPGDLVTTVNDTESATVSRADVDNLTVSGTDTCMLVSERKEEQEQSSPVVTRRKSIDDSIVPGAISTSNLAAEEQIRDMDEAYSKTPHNHDEKPVSGLVLFS